MLLRRLRSVTLTTLLEHLTYKEIGSKSPIINLYLKDNLTIVLNPCLYLTSDISRPVFDNRFFILLGLIVMDA